MDPRFITAIMIFVIISAIALLLQLGFLVGMYMVLRKVQAAAQPLIYKVDGMMPKVDAMIPKVDAMIPKVEGLIPKAEGIMESSKAVVDNGQRQIQELTTKASEILDVAKQQLQRVDGLLGEASSRARVQMDRAEAVLDDAMSRTQQTVAMLNGGVVKPIREIQGVAAGIRTALIYLTKGRPNPTQATADEEMFI